MLKKWRRSLALLLVFLFLMPATALADYATLDYVSLGDSVAAGYDPYTQTDQTSYADLINEALRDAGVPGTYLKAGVTGYTSNDLLRQVTLNSTVRNRLNKSELVTITIGANDLLPILIWANTEPLRLDTYPGKVGKLTLALLYKTLPADDFLSTVLAMEIRIMRSKVELTINTIKWLPGKNPKIYLMGYYNPFPYIPEAAEALSAANSQLKLAAAATGAKFVPTVDSINYMTHLVLLPQDPIHLNPLGHEVVAELFLNRIAADFQITLN